MSDTRREIAERYSPYRKLPKQDGIARVSPMEDMLAAMSEYAAALLEEVAKQTAGVAESMSCTTDENSVEQFAEMLRARAAQERAR